VARGTSTVHLPGIIERSFELSPFTLTVPKHLRSNNTYGPTTILPSVIEVTASRDRTCRHQEISNEKSLGLIGNASGKNSDNEVEPDPRRFR
jgi:hypothetical protein